LKCQLYVLAHSEKLQEQALELIAEQEANGSGAMAMAHLRYLQSNTLLKHVRALFHTPVAFIHAGKTDSHLPPG
jgi:hypothetical protein